MTYLLCRVRRAVARRPRAHGDARRRGQGALLRLRPGGLQALRLDAVGDAVRAGRRALRAAGRDHQPERDAAVELRRDRDLGRRSAAAARWRVPSSARSWSTAARAGSRPRSRRRGSTCSASLFVVVTLFLPGGHGRAVRGARRGRGVRSRDRALERAHGDAAALPPLAAAPPTAVPPVRGSWRRPGGSDVARQRGARRPVTAQLLEVDKVTVSFDGFRALNDLTLHARGGRAALHRRPQRRRQDDADGLHHRQDAARHRHRALRRANDLTRFAGARNRRARHRAQVPAADGLPGAHGVREPASSARRATRASSARCSRALCRRRAAGASSRRSSSSGFADHASRLGGPALARAEAVAGDRDAAGPAAEAAARRRAGRGDDASRRSSGPRRSSRRWPASTRSSWSSTTWTSSAASPRR